MKAKTKQKSKCTATNAKGKCLVYTKTHKTAKALKSHISKIKNRNGIVKQKKNADGSTTIQYSFPKKK